MKIKTATQKKEGQARSASAQRRTRDLSEPGLLQAATHTAGLLAQGDDLTASGAEPTPAPASGVVIEATNAAGEAEDAGSTLEIQVEAEQALTPAVEAEPVAPVEVVAFTDHPVPATRPGLVESPLAQRMRAEAELRRAGKAAERKQRVSHRGLGSEFDLATARVKSLKVRLNAARAKLSNGGDPEVAARLADVRVQLRESRGSRVEGVEPFNAAIKQARASLQAAKDAKREFLAAQGVEALVTTDDGVSLRQQLRALRAQMREGADQAGGAEVAELRRQLREAKTERHATCERAHAAREKASAQPEGQVRADALEPLGEGGDDADASF